MNESGPKIPQEEPNLEFYKKFTKLAKELTPLLDRVPDKAIENWAELGLEPDIIEVSRKISKIWEGHNKHQQELKERDELP